MGCPWSCCRSDDEKGIGHRFIGIDDPHPQPGPPNPGPRPPPPRPPTLHPRPIPTPSPVPLPVAKDESRVNLYVPIYIAKRSYENVQTTDEIPFKEGDEFKLISEVNAHQLCLQHLRTGRTGLVQKSHVRYDPASPLRLAMNDRGIIEQCLAKENRLGAYVIRGSRQNAMEYVFSINQKNPANNLFHFRDERSLRDFEFASFHSLVRHSKVRQTIPLTEPLPHVIDFEDEVWNIPLYQLDIGVKIGQGEFGEVFRGVWKHGDISTPVAIKKIRTNGITAVVRQEVEAMKTLTNLYIVSLKGVTKDPWTNDIFLVTEYMENGDLKSWLTRLPQLPPHEKLYRFASYISTGMSYLEDRNYVHRDLACRNILVGPGANTVKIADFGLSTIVYDGDLRRQQENAAEKLAFRWLAPELFTDRAAFSIGSDVWSYGILLIEMWQKGTQPYDGAMKPYVESFVLSGEIHRRPDECPEEFFDSIIRPCLRFASEDRPTFRTLKQLLHTWRS